jgi:hypothetical protein
VAPPQLSQAFLKWTSTKNVLDLGDHSGVTVNKLAYSGPDATETGLAKELPPFLMSQRFARAAEKVVLTQRLSPDMAQVAHQSKLSDATYVPHFKRFSATVGVRFGPSEQTFAKVHAHVGGEVDQLEFLSQEDTYDEYHRKMTGALSLLNEVRASGHAHAEVGDVDQGSVSMDH